MKDAEVAAATPTKKKEPSKKPAGAEVQVPELPKPPAVVPTTEKDK